MATQPSATSGQSRNPFQQAGDWAWNPFVNPLVELRDNAADFFLGPLGGGSVGPQVGHSASEAQARAAQIDEMLSYPGRYGLTNYEIEHLKYLRDSKDVSPNDVVAWLQQYSQRAENNASRGRWLNAFDEGYGQLGLDRQIDTLEDRMAKGDYLSLPEYKQGFDAMNNTLIAGQKSNENVAAGRAAATGVRDSGFSQDQLRRDRLDAGAVRGGYLSELPGRTQTSLDALKRERFGLKQTRADVEANPFQAGVEMPDFTGLQAANRSGAIGGNQWVTGATMNLLAPWVNPATYLQPMQAGMQGMTNLVGAVAPKAIRFG